ncbi:MAG: plastocyanin/azurin family copper-binding protein [Patescibacteria group bacterium]
MSNKLIVALLILLVLTGGFLLFKNKSVAPTEIEVENTMPVPGSEVDEMIVGNESAPVPSPAPSATSLTPAVKEFTVDNEMFSFKPSSLTVNKGDTVKITFRNTGGTHDLKIDEFKAATRLLSTGEQQTITFVADKAGSFEYYCSVGNHRAQGMWGTLTVR